MKKNTKRAVCCSFLLWGAICLANAYSLAFQIIQRDTEGGIIRNLNYKIEENLFDFFFDRGIIVSNSPVVLSADQSNDMYVFGESIGEADAGGVDYFIEFVSVYGSADSTNPEAANINNLESLSWTLVNVETGEKLGEGKKIPAKLKSERYADKGTADFASAVAGEIISRIRR